MKITICRKAHFNAAHKLYNPSLSNDENFEIFGKCSYENFHGHNYELIVKILGDINPQTSFDINVDGTYKFNDFGIGFVIMPSGLGYYNSPVGGLPSYSPLIFHIEMITINQTDHDNDSVLTINEDLDGDSNFDNDDTDSDSIANYLDPDDDNDGILTKDEYDADGDGIADDSDGDGIPDYLDNE